MTKPLCITVNTFQGDQTAQSVDLENFLRLASGHVVGMTGIVAGPPEASGI
jgi:hypothetical protein